MGRRKGPTKEQLAEFVEMLMDPSISKQAIARHFKKNLATIYRWENRLPDELRQRIDERRKHAAINPRNIRLPIDRQWVKEWAAVKNKTFQITLEDIGEEPAKPQEAPAGAFKEDGQLDIVKQLMEINQKTWSMLSMLHAEVTEDFAHDVQKIRELLQKVASSPAKTLPDDVLQLIRQKVEALGVPDVNDFVKIIKEIREQIKLQVEVTTQLCNLQAQYEFVTDMVYIIDEVIGRADPELKYKVLSELQKRRAVRDTISGFAAISRK